MSQNRRKKIKYAEGDVFAAALSDGSFSIGVVARAPRNRSCSLEPA